MKQSFAFVLGAAAVLDQRRWSYQSVWWLFHDGPVELVLTLPARAKLISVAMQTHCNVDALVSDALSIIRDRTEFAVRIENPFHLSLKLRQEIFVVLQ